MSDVNTVPTADTAVTLLRLLSDSGCLQGFSAVSVVVKRTGLLESA